MREREREREREIFSFSLVLRRGDKDTDLIYNHYEALKKFFTHYHIIK